MTARTSYIVAHCCSHCLIWMLNLSCLTLSKFGLMRLSGQSPMLLVGAREEVANGFGAMVIVGVVDLVGFC